ncbi:MAG: hypothetical protein IH624_11795 [Phycisphaerae bacterium]|nr:hypothetical protein [Phycisphaerae bacterium]
MSEYNERRLLRRLHAISQIQPAPESTDRAIRNVRASVEQLEDTSPSGRSRGHRLLTPRRWCIAAAAVVLAAVIVAGALLWNGSGKGPQDVVKQSSTADPVALPREEQKETEPAESPTQPSPIKQELKHIFALAEAGDLGGLLKTLEQGSFAGKLVAASYLADLGDERAIRPLEQLSAEWYGDTDANPFAAAVAQIKRRLSQSDDEGRTPPLEPNVEAGSENMGIADSPEAAKTGTTPSTGLFEKIVQVHCIQEKRLPDGSLTKGEIWIRLPDCIREDDPETGRIIIDNGAQRLTLDTSEKQAQLSESYKHVEPLRDHWLLGQIEEIRGSKEQNDFVLTKIEDESTESVWVFTVEMTGHVSAEGKVWIQTAGMLPVKLEAQLAGDPNSQDAQSARITFDYRPISDKVFALTIPNDYTELAPKQAGAFGGHVVDVSGNPVAGAVVSVKSYGLPDARPLTATANEQGVFSVRMPANLSTLSSPVVIWATLPNQPDFVGWTLLRSELDEEQHELGGAIPGDPGIIHVSPDYKVTRAEETVWTTGWCMGASDIILVMQQAARIVGQATDPTGGGIAGAGIDVQFELSGKTGAHAYSFHDFWSTKTLTDENGFYRAGYLPRLWKQCRWRVGIAAEGFVGQSEVLTSEGSLDVMTANFQLHRAAVTVRGVLKDNYGTPLPGRAIFATVNGKQYHACSTKSDAVGKFELTGCPDAPGLGLFAELSHNPHAPGPARDSFEHYPDLAVGVPYELRRTEYEVEMVATLPELTIEVDVVDSTGHPLSWYPVEIRAERPVSTQWKVDRGFYAIADEAGFCRLVKVPNVPGLRVVLSGQYYTSSYQHLAQPQREAIEECMKLYRNKYKWTEVPVEIEPGRKEYYIRATVLTNEESQQGVFPR